MSHEEIQESIKQQLRAYLAEGWTLYAIGKRAGVSSSSIADFLEPGRTLRGDKLIRIIVFLGSRLTKFRRIPKAPPGNPEVQRIQRARKRD